MLLAHELGAQLIVAVGTYNSMEEFLDKGARHGVHLPRPAPSRRAPCRRQGREPALPAVVKTPRHLGPGDRRDGRPPGGHAHQRAAAPVVAQPVDLPSSGSADDHLRTTCTASWRSSLRSPSASPLAPTVVQRSVVDNLRSTQGRIEQNLDELEAQKAELQERTAALEGREVPDRRRSFRVAVRQLAGQPLLVRSQGIGAIGTRSTAACCCRPAARSWPTSSPCRRERSRGRRRRPELGFDADGADPEQLQADIGAPG